MKLNKLTAMSVLRWKPLKSSFQQAKALTGVLQIINIKISRSVVLLGVIALFTGAIIPALSCFVSAVFLYFLLKLGSIALKLLTQIADDTRLQLLAVAGNEYDQKISSKEKAEDEPDKIDLDKDEKRDFFNDAIAGFKRNAGVNEPSFENSTVYNWKQVILRDGDSKRFVLLDYRCDKRIGT